MTTHLHASIVRDEAALLALGPAWDALEARARAAGRPARLYDSHRYVRLAWQHLREPGDRLFIVTLAERQADPRGDPGGLRAVWPLVLRGQRVAGLPTHTLIPIGLWEGERPGVLCDGDPDAAWAALWDALVRERRHWHALELREVDAGAWPLRQLAQPGGGWRVHVRPDNDTLWLPRRGPWADVEAMRPAPVREALLAHRAELARRASKPSRRAVDDPATIDAAFSAYLAIDASHGDGPASEGLYRLGRDPARVAFYRDFLPLLAARGEAQVWLLEDDGAPIAGLIRLRAGGVWIERHATEHAALSDLAPATGLLLDALSRSWDDDTVQQSDLLLLPDASGRTTALRAWYDVRPTHRMTIWNLRSRMALAALANRLRGR